MSVARVTLGPEDDVIDVGAAPGSWSGWLAGRARRVVAVDPAQLSADVLALPNVIHGESLYEFYSMLSC